MYLKQPLVYANMRERGGGREEGRGGGREGGRERGREGGRKGEGEGGRERRAKITWYNGYNSTLAEWNIKSTSVKTSKT